MEEIMDDLRSKYGSHINLGQVVLGRNLNLWVLRGFAPLDLLSEISSADVYDEYKNPQGTQRDLTKAHSQEALEYAIDSEEVSPETDPRAFPEVILNARDISVIEVFDGAKYTNIIDFDSINGNDESENRILSVRVRTDVFTWPKPPYQPQISRVDGNHRLFQAENAKDDEDFDSNEPLPEIPFSLFIGLNATQERKIFKDINANQKGMESAFLDTIVHSQSDEVALLSDPKTRALVIAKRLTATGSAFDGKVFTGGSKKGAKEKYGEVPPLKLNALKRAVQTTLRKADRLVEAQFPTILDSNELTQMEYQQKLVTGVDAVTIVLDRYWKAVSFAYPEAWQNRKDFILLQSIGLEGFSILAARIIQDLMFNVKKWEQEDFNGVMQGLALQFKLNKENFAGIAGAAGATEIYSRASAKISNDAQIAAVMNQSLGVNTAASEIG
jgi:DGQHR domain-containing protein